MQSSHKQRWSIRFLPIVSMLGSMLLGVPAEASTPKIGGGTCSNATLAGTYYYLVNGDVLSNGQRVSAALLGKFVADGVGQVTGTNVASVNGQQSNVVSFTDRFNVQSNCSGVFIESSDNITFQMVNNGVELIMAVSTSDGVLLGTAYRQTLGTSPIQCGNGSLSGAYGYQLVGDYGGSPYADAGQLVADGNGNYNTTSVANVGSSPPVTSIGTYTVANDCSGTAQVSNQNGTLNYQFAVVEDGKGALFFCTTPGWTVAGDIYPPVRTTAELRRERSQFPIGDGFSGIVVLDLRNRANRSTHVRRNGASSKFAWRNTGTRKRYASAVVVRGR